MRLRSVEQAQELARRRLPAPVYAALLAGSEAGLSYADNLTAFGRLGFAPPALPGGGAEQVDLTTTVLGQRVSLPVILSPTGVQAVHPDGEVAVARAAAAAGTAVGLSSLGSRPIEDVVAANPATFAQICWTGDRDGLLAALARAHAAGAKALILTLDWTFSQGRDWGSPVIPERIDARAVLAYGPAVLRRPGWLLSWARAGRLPDLRVPNLMPSPGQAGPTFFAGYRDWQATPPPTWDDVAGLRSQWPGPFLLKGIGRADDARRAVAAGVSGVSVSNHGGNNLDGTPAPIRLLPAVAAAVGGQVEVLLDGGVRSGPDVVKALALGADAVMIGRPYLWGLGAGGEPGVRAVLELFRTGLTATLAALGRTHPSELTCDDVLIPDDFTRSPGD
jgi:heme/flavin dehydrogenase (mycofactocin system)